MIAKELHLENHRNLEPTVLSLDPAMNLFTGDNGQGKTNILEALWLFAALKSFRAGAARDLVRFGAEESRLSLSFSSQKRDMEAELRLSQQSRRRLTLNGNEVRRAADYIGLFCAVLFTPEHLELVKAGPAERRRFLDMALCQMRPRYFSALSEYQRVLRQKSALLRKRDTSPSDGPELELWNERLVLAGVTIIRLRSAYVKALAARAAEFLGELSGGAERLTLGYTSLVPELPEDERELAACFRRRLEALRTAERESRQCLAGPHRDDVDIRINDRSARLYGSQGQQRSCVLTMKLAEGELLRELTGEYPVFLFDDVLSELDLLRQGYITEQLGGRQVILTCCRSETLPELPVGKRFAVRRGRVE